ncbi:MAG TPA: rhomboid family intramembrane serine protease [Phycisphaerae bacterium]|nr:rhomboid family intramembrane serine protease [Phycisphaerae bacterium]
MIPIRDSIPSRSAPVVNYGIIAVNIAVFLVQLSAGPQAANLIDRYAMIPARVTRPDAPVFIPEVHYYRTPFGIIRRVARQPILSPPFPAYLTLLTCIVLHGSWLHLLGNCWFLYIFGDNVEDRLGHLLYLLFYVFSGMGASLIYWAVDPFSTVPVIGASGAIAGVLGAYFLLYPHAHVLTLIPVFIFPWILVLPAYVFLGVWFLFQFLQGSSALTTGQTGGVAWWAHIGGFLVGGGGLLVLKYTGLLRPPPTWRRQARPVRIYRYRVR